MQRGDWRGTIAVAVELEQLSDGEHHQAAIERMLANFALARYDQASRELESLVARVDRLGPLAPRVRLYGAMMRRQLDGERREELTRSATREIERLLADERIGSVTRTQCLLLSTAIGTDPRRLRTLIDQQRTAHPEIPDLPLLAAAVDYRLGNLRTSSAILKQEVDRSRLSSAMVQLADDLQQRLDQEMTVVTTAAPPPVGSLRQEFERLLQAYASARRSDETRAMAAMLATLLVKERDVDGNRPQRARLDEALARWRAGETEAAADGVLAAIDAEPDDIFIWLKGASLLLLVGRDDDYERIRRRAVERFAGTETPEVAERVAKLASLRPYPDDQFAEQVGALARRAVELGTDSPYRHYFIRTAALVAARRGEYDEATRAAMIAEFDADHPWAVTARLIDALAAQREGDRTRVEVALARVAEAIDRFDPTFDAEDHDRQYDRILADELSGAAETRRR